MKILLQALGLNLRPMIPGPRSAEQGRVVEETVPPTAMSLTIINHLDVAINLEPQRRKTALLTVRASAR